MDPAPTERDARLVDLLDQALADLRAGRPLDTATWQGLAPDLGDDLPELLETLRDLDNAAETWRCGRTIAPEPTGNGGAALSPEMPARLGRYEALEPLGAGGMGRVYKARDPQLGRTVAVKVPHLHGDAATRELRKTRFLREARAAARVRHPHVCPIYDVGEEGGLPYVVMAFIEGQSLAERLRQQGRYDDPRAAVALVLQVAAALEAVHAHGIVHRDLKPGNVLLDLPGTSAFLSDFGLARPGDADENLTIDGDLVGTPAYMAAEQAAGQAEKVGPWTDLYGLGVVLYQMLTGRLPFEGPTTLSVLHKIGTETPPPPSQFRADLDPALEAVVQKALARRPEDRFASAREFAEALDRWASGLPPLTAEGSPTPAAAAPAAPAAAPPAEAQAAASPGQQTVVLSGLPDGQTLQLALPAGAKADVKVTMTGGAGGKRVKKKRPWRVTVSISLSVAALLVAVGVAFYLNQPTHFGSGDPQHAARSPSKAEQDRLAEARRRAEEARALAEAKKAKAKDFVLGPPPTDREPVIRLELVEARPGGAVVSEVLARVKDDQLVADLPPYVKDAPDGPQTFVMHLPDQTSVVVRGKVDRGQLVAAWSRELTTRAHARPKAPSRQGPDKLKRAEAALRKAVALRPDSPRAHTDLGTALLAQKKLPEAEAAFREAIRLNPRFPEAYTRLGEALRGQGRMKDAMAAHQKGLALQPNSAEALNYVGVILAAQGKANEAVDAYRRAIRLRSDYAEAYNNLAVALLKQKKPQEAKAHFLKAVALSGRAWPESQAKLLQPLSVRQKGGPQLARLDEPTVTVLFRRDASLSREEKDATRAVGLVGLLPQTGPAPRFAALALLSPVGGGGRPPVPLLRPADRPAGPMWAFFNGQQTAAPRELAELWLQAAGDSLAVWSRDGKCLAARDQSNHPGEVTVWDAQSGETLCRLDQPSRTVCSVAFSPDGKHLAVGSGDGVVKVWDLAGRKSVLTVAAHTGRVNAVCFSPDGKRLASGSEDRTARVWLLAGGKEVRRLTGPRAGLTALTFSPDGKKLATAGKDGQAWLWDVATGKPLAATPRGPDPIAALEFSAGGDELLSCDAVETIRVWEAAPGK
jgi:tetratricopeptide (TPR) repeat protein